MGCFPNHSWKETLAKGWLGRRRRFWSRNTGKDGAVHVFSSLCCDETLAPLPWNTISVEGLATVVASRLGAMHTFTLFLFWIRLSCHPTLSRFTASCVCVCRVRWCHRTASIGYEYFSIWFDGVGTFAVWISSTHGAFLYPRILFSLGLWQPLQTIIDTECGSFSCFYVFFSFAEDASYIANILDSGFFLRHSGAFAMSFWVFCCYTYLFLRPAMQNFISRLGQPHSFLFYCVFFFLFWRKTENHRCCCYAAPFGFHDNSLPLIGSVVVVSSSFSFSYFAS